MVVVVVVVDSCGRRRMSREQKGKASEVESRSCGCCCIESVLVMQGMTTLFWKDSRHQLPFLLEKHFFDFAPPFEHNFSSVIFFDSEDLLLLALAVAILISAGAALHDEKRPFLVGTPTTYFERRASNCQVPKINVFGGRRSPSSPRNSY
jgi:hypothetical protein